ncbi:MAG: hypothetical protein QGI08_11040 [Paracoccaceae bacterium]|nr:hypothetical protein [Paracoccaceae bacterium]MDP7186248.1 hypothetical protein [Paracoccaceae bacterium]
MANTGMVSHSSEVDKKHIWLKRFAIRVSLSFITVSATLYLIRVLI